jgi:heparinase II/III-like protein
LGSVLEIAPPRRVFCVFEHKYRSADVAEAVVSGRYPIQGVTLPLGLEPDWLGAPLPRDKEWRLEWSKFYFGLDLATAAERTGSPVYLSAWLRIVNSWIAQVPIDYDPTDVVGRRIQNWIYAWSRFAERFDVEAAMPGFPATVLESLRAQVAHLHRNLTRERNHRTLELYALFVAALALPALDPDGDLLRYSIGALHENLMTDVLPDGVQRERSTHYHHVVLRSFVGMRENARRFALAVPPGFDDRLARACEFALHCHRPDGAIPAMSDSDSGSYLDLLHAAGGLLGRSDFTYAATRGLSGEAPSTTMASFPDGGYFVQRSGWGSATCDLADERYLIFDCGALGDGGHGHYDALNVEIAAGGGPIVVDPGRYTYCDAPPHWRQWFKGTSAHNTVTVDGANQTPYRRGKPKGPVASARIRQRATERGLDLLWGEAESPAYEVVHRRRILFVGDEYWLIEDELDGHQPHRYQLRYHLTPDQAHVSLEPGRDTSRARTPRVSLVVSGDAMPGVEPGWVSFEYGIKHAAPVVTFTTDGVARTRLVTLVSPRITDDERSPELRVLIDGRMAIAEVSGGPGDDVIDRVGWTLDGAPAAGNLAPGRALAWWIRESAAGSTLERVALTTAAISEDDLSAERAAHEVRS